MTVETPLATVGGTLAGFLTPEQLSKQLGISTRTLSRWHAMRVGPPRCGFGKLIRYRADAVREWFASKEQGCVVPSRRRR